MRHTLLAWVVALAATTASAQDRTTVFIHGLNSGPATWIDTQNRLAAELAIRPLTADLSWQSFYENQADELERELGGSTPADAIAVGHSNGGVVARQWSRRRDLNAIVTLGSPNQGAPIVDHVFEWLAFLDDIFPRISNVTTVFANDVNPEAWWWLPAQWSERFSRAFDVYNTAGNGLFSLGLDFRLPVLSEMRVASSFMHQLNDAAARDREAAEVPNRVAIVNVARDFYEGGPFRMVRPDSYGDWHTALVPVYIDTVEWMKPLHAAASLYTIHNLAYQGVFDSGALPLTGLGPEHYHARELEHFGTMNLTKAACHRATFLSTVSPTYAREIQTMAHGFGLDGVLAERSSDFFGVLNGIDAEEWNPETDPLIPAHFSARSLAGKTECKRTLQAESGLPVRSDVPVYGLVGRLTRQKGVDVVAQILAGMLDLDLQMILLGSGDRDVEAYFAHMAGRHRDRFAAWTSSSGRIYTGLRTTRQRISSPVSRMRNAAFETR